MSTSIDERIVKMEFDNRQFESGVQTSLSTLDKLKNSLNFDSASKSLSALQEAGKSFQMNDMSKAVETVIVKFDAMSMAAMAAIQNIVNSAIAAGKRIANALTIAPITTGFQEYETQINATQTILANTQKEGATIKDVNKALDELNKYADLTIYNFTEMTKNIGTFTAAGVKLDTSVNAIQGIANLAAVSGSTSQQASTAMYQLSQALSSGTVKLQDWNSVVNAGMGGKTFQDALMETARVHGIAIDKMVKSEGSFRETLSKGWLTSDILTETLQHFTTFTDEYNEKTLKAQGYTDAQIKEIKQLGITATDAATKVKTFTQLWDVLQEAAQSGWSQSWRIIVGDFEQAKSTLTEFSDVLTETINKSSQSRIDLLTEGLSSGFEQLLSKGIMDRDAYIDSIKEVAKEHGVAVDDIIEKSGSFEDSLKEGWVTSDILKESIQKLTNETNGLSAKQLKSKGYTDVQIEALKKLNEEVQNGTINVDELTESIGQMSGRENLMTSLMNIFKAVMSVITPVKEAFTEIFPPMTGEQLYAITEAIKNFTEKLILSENAAKKVKGVMVGWFTLVKPIWTGVANAAKLLGLLASKIIPVLADRFITVTGYLGNLYYELCKIIDINKVMNSVYKGTETIIDSCVKGLSTLTDSIGYLIQYITGVDFSNFDEVAALIEPWIDKLEIFKKNIIEAFEALSKGEPESSSAIRSLQAALVSLKGDLADFSERTKEVTKRITEFASKVKTFLTPAIVALKDAFKSVTITDLIGTGLLSGIVVFIKKLTDQAGSLTESISDTLESVRDTLESYQNTLKANTLLKIAASVSVLAASLVLLTTIDSDRLKSGLIGISVLLGEVVGVLYLLSSDFLKLDFGKTAKAAASMVILSVALSTLAGALAKCKEFESWDKTFPGLTAMMIMMGSLTAMAISLGKWGGDSDIVKASVGIFIFAAAIKQLAKAIAKFATLNVAEIAKGLTTLAIMLGEISAFIHLTELSELGHAKKTIAEIAVSMIILYEAVKLFGKLKPEVLLQGMTVLGTVLSGLVIAVRSISGVNVAGSTGTLLALAAAVTALTIPIFLLGKMSLLTLAKGLTSVGLAIAALCIGLGIIKGSSGDLAGASIALLAMSVALTALAVPIKIFGSMSLFSIASGLTAMVASLLVLGASAKLLVTTSTALSGLAKSVLFIGAGALGVSLAIGAITVALVTLATLGAGGVAAIIASLTGLIVGITSIMPLIQKALVALLAAVLNTIKDTGPLLIETVITLIDGLIQAVANHAESIVRGLIKVVIAVFKAVLSIIAEYFGPLAKAGANAIANLVKGFGSKIKDVASKAKECMKTFLDNIKSGKYIKDIIIVGHNLIDGFINGIKEKVSSLPKVVQAVGSTVLTALKNVLGIHSPSKETQKLAKYTIDGFIKGLEDNKTRLAEASDMLGSEVITSLEDNLANVMSQLTYGQKAMQNFVWAFGDMTSVEAANKSFETARSAIYDYTKSLYLESDAYKENAANAKALEKERDSLQKKIDKLSKKTDEESKKQVKSLKEDLKETTKEYDKAQKEITEGTKEFIKNQRDAYNNLRDSISESIKSAIDPMSVSLETQIDLFKEFSSDAEALLSDTLISNMESQVQGITNWNKNLEELSQRGFAKGLLDQLKSMGPTASNYIQAFMNMTNEQMIKANEAFEASSKLTSQTLISNFQESLESAKQWANDLAELAVRGLNEGMIEQLGKAGTSSAEYVEAFMSMTAAQLQEFNQSYAEYLKLPNNVASSVMASFAFAGSDMATAFSQDLMALSSSESEQNQQLVTNMKTTGENMTQSLKEGVKSQESSAKSAATSVGKSVYNGINSYVSTSKGKSLGTQMINGLVKGLNAGKSSAVNAAVRVAVAAYEAACEALDINSPSKKFEAIGRFADLGLAQGFRMYSHTVEDEAAAVGSRSLSTMQQALLEVSKYVDGDMELNPVVTPVLNLDNLNSGLAMMNGMFGSRAIDFSGIQGRTSAISSTMNARDSVNGQSSKELQNGAKSFSFVQNNYSPKALSQVDIYRQTKNQFSAMKGALEGI